MKTLKLIFSLTVVCALCFSVKPAQAKKEIKDTYLYKITDKNDTVHEFTLTGVSFITPSGNVLRSYSIQVPDDVMEKIVFDTIANKIMGVRVSNINNSGETVTGYGYLNKAGNLNFNVHSNGAGNIFPKGWN